MLQETNSFNNMTLRNKLTFLSLLGVSIFFAFRNRQVETNLLKENPTASAIQAKIIKTQNSAPVVKVGLSLIDTKGNLWFITRTNEF